MRSRLAITLALYAFFYAAGFVALRHTESKVLQSIGRMTSAIPDMLPKLGWRWLLPAN